MQNRTSTYKNMKSIVSSQSLDNYLPIVSIDYNFADIDSNAFIDGSMDLDTVTGKIKDNNRTNTPYNLYHVSLAGFMTSSAITNVEYRLKLNKELHLTNTDKSLTKIKITNLSTNSSIELLPNNEAFKTIKFETEGTHILSFEITFNDLSVATCFEKLDIKANPYKTLGDDCDPVHDIISSTIPFQGYDESVATTSHADYHIYYHYTTPTSGVCEKVLRKPIIILDGFDPKDADRDFQFIFDNSLSYQNGGTKKLGKTLREKGFDVIILNFPTLGDSYDPTNSNLKIPTTVTTPSNTTINVGDRDGGADYIERNAFLLVALIQKINTQKVGSEKLVIVGPSMGGQISRYALAYMEKQEALSIPNMKHDTRLWVSFDSPHEGANIAISAQQFLYHMAYQYGDQDAQDKYEDKLRSKAARQLLIEQIDGLNRSSTFHSTYYTNLEANGLPNSHGYPQNLRKVTLINGSGAGTSNGIADAIAMGVDANADLGINGFVCTLKNMPLTGQAGLTADILARRPKKQKFGLLSYYSSTTTTNLTNNMEYKYKYADFTFAIGMFNIKRVKTYKGEFTTTNSNPRGSMDVVPGGIYDVYQETKNGIVQVLNNEGSIQTQTWNPNISKMAFIPTISSLGFKNPNFNWNNLINNRNLVCNNEIYFDNYYAPQNNENHTDLNTANVAWIEQEIDKGHNDINCIPICTSNFTSPVTTICSTSNTTLTFNTAIPNLPNYFTTWTCSPNIQIVSSSNNSVTVIALSYGTNSFVKAEINNPCGANVIIENKGISVGIPNPPAPSITLSPTANCYKWSVTVQFPTPPNGTTYDWGVGVYPNCTASACSMTGTNAGTFTKIMNSGQNIQWSSSATNSCGTELNDGQILQLDVTSCSPYTAQLNYVGVPLKTNYQNSPLLAPQDDIMIFPNPSTTHWTISIMKNEITSLSYLLTDITGKKLKQNSYEDINLNDFIIDNSNLPNGTYLLKIQTESNSYNFKLLKN